MRWFAIHHELATNPKWLGLSMDERGAWISLLTIAAASEERGTLRDRRTAAALLQREMGQASRPAAHVVGSLIDAGLIDEDEGGTLAFHDFGEWQLRIKKPSDWPDAIRARVSKHRALRKGDLDLEVEVEVTPGNALPTSFSLHPCPRCGSAVRLIEGAKGVFYGCSDYSAGGCPWKSDKPPKPRGPLLDLNSPENRRLRGEVA